MSDKCIACILRENEKLKKEIARLTSYSSDLARLVEQRHDTIVELRRKMDGANRERDKALAKLADSVSHETIMAVESERNDREEVAKELFEFISGFHFPPSWVKEKIQSLKNDHHWLVKSEDQNAEPS